MELLAVRLAGSSSSQSSPHTISHSSLALTPQETPPPQANIVCPPGHSGRPSVRFGRSFPHSHPTVLPCCCRPPLFPSSSFSRQSCSPFQLLLHKQLTAKSFLCFTTALLEIPSNGRLHITHSRLLRLTEPLGAHSAPPSSPT